jgi:1,4-dihydroxy-2-naphthoate octaprenyltransferase
MAARPRTLTLSAVPVAVATALAWSETGQVQWPATAAALVGALFIQIGTNLHNDAADFERGADGPQRIGPRRVTAEGLLTAAQVKRGAAVSFGVAAVAGLLLIYIGGWPILALGLCSILAGWGYTGGPRPIAYTPLGEVFVLAFFGLGAVLGTYWLDCGRISPAALTVGVGIGLFASAVLLVNNHRDSEDDARNGRHTLAMLAGAGLTPSLYAAFLLVPFALLPLIDHLVPGHHAWIALAMLPVAFRLQARFRREPKGPGFNIILARTAQVQLGYGVLLGLGLLL